MKRIIVLSMMAAGVTLYACNGGNNSSDAGESYKGYVSNAERTPVTMDGKPVPQQKETTTTADESAPAEGGIDINAPSDSKGVGAFTEVAVGPGVDADLAAKGKELFQTTCTACHTPTDQRLIGPGLKGITKIRTPEWIMNMITNPIKMTKNDPVAKALLKEFNNVQMTDQNVSNDDARAILEFLRQNDGVE